MTGDYFMQDLYFKNEDHLNVFVKNLQFIGFGSEGCCYKLNKNTVFKYLCGPSYEEKTKDEILQFKNVKIPNYVFAQNIAYLNDEIVGVLMRYISGKKVENKLFQVRISSLIKAFDDLVVATRKLSKLGISVYDICTVNMLYNNSRFYLIDTMDYVKKDIDSEQIFIDNMVAITKEIESAIIPLSVLNFINSIPEICNFRKDNDLLVNPSYILKILSGELNNYFGYEIKTFEEASKKLIKY